MYGSQLSAGETHYHNKLVPGASDSGIRDVPVTVTDVSPKPTPPASSTMMSQKNPMTTSSKNVKMSKTSKKSENSEKSESATVR